jgi:anaerobic glycerol-3-phosphate dehydrogenase
MAADLANFSIRRNGSANMNMPRWIIECDVIHSRTGALIRSFQGANAINFPAVLGQLTAEQRDELIEMLVLRMIEMRLG